MRWVVIGDAKNGPTFKSIAINLEEIAVIRQNKNVLEFYSKTGKITSIETDITLIDLIIKEENLANVSRN